VNLEKINTLTALV